METKKRTYFKLGAQASMFSDYSNKLKVTRNVPGSTLKPETKPTKEARSNGHIIEISEHEFNEMMKKITPEERKCAYEEQGLTEEEAGSEDAGGSGGGEEDTERAELLKRLKPLKMTKSKREEISALPTAELKAFIEAEEEK